MSGVQPTPAILPAASMAAYAADFAAYQQHMLQAIPMPIATAANAKPKKTVKRKMEPLEDDFSDEGKGGARQKVRSGSNAGRFSSSLGVLTQKFIALWQETSQLSELDLNEASTQLHVAKRRIYDITNVLEGIGLISKKSKNLIQWRGNSGSAGINGPINDQRREIAALKAELEALQQEETMVDDYIAHMQETVNFTHAFESNANSCYMTYEDIRSIPDFQGKVLIAVKAPKGTKLDVPDLSEINLQEPHPYQVIMTSPDGPVEIFVVSQDQVDRREGEDAAFPFLPSGANSPMQPMQPPLSPNMSSGELTNQHSDGRPMPHLQSSGVSQGGGLGLTSVPNSPFPHSGAGSSSPYPLNLASPGFNHHTHPGLANARTPLAHHHLSHHLHPSPTPLVNALQPPGSAGPASRLGSPAFSRMYPTTHSPYHAHTAGIGGGMVFRPGMISAGSPLLSSVGGVGGVGVASAATATSGGVMKLEPPSNDPDYYMNLDADEGLTDLYANHHDHSGMAKSASDGGPAGGSGGGAWPEEDDNIFATSPAVTGQVN